MIYTNKQLFDLHLHSHYSDDSNEDPEEVIKKALSNGLSAICFTDHNDFDYKDHDGTPMFNIDFDKYLKGLNALKDNYQKENLTILIGLEQGLTIPAKDRIESFDPDKDLDFIIGSTHVVNGIDPYYSSYWDSQSPKEAIRLYFENMHDCVRQIDNFDVYGHLDYITRYMPDQSLFKDLASLLPLDLVEVILKDLIYKGKGIEINTAGWRKGLFSNPCPLILKMYHDLGGEIITTGSDAHTSIDLGKDLNKAHELLLASGFKYQSIFKKRKVDFIKL